MRFQSIIIAAPLTALVAFSSASWAAEKAGTKESEQPIAVDQLPPAVKAALAEQVAGAAVLRYEQQTRDGKPVYAAEVAGKKKGQVVEYVVAEDGQPIATEPESAKAGKKKGHHDGKSRKKNR